MVVGSASTRGDGRVRQPGKGVARPRGFLAGEEIPDTARVGSSAFVAALVSALAHSGTLTLAAALAPALAICPKNDPRGAFLGHIKDRGTRAFLDFREPLLAASGRLAGGLLTEEDLGEIEARMKPLDGARTESAARSKIFRTPWPEAERPVRGARVHAIAATDRAGAFAVLCYEEHQEGIAVKELGLLAPLYAEPVVRGKTRTRPGHALSAVAPIALVSLGSNIGAALAARPGTDADKEIGASAAAIAEGTLLSSEAIIGVIRAEDAAASLFEG